MAQLLRCVQLFMTLWTTAHQASLSFSISQSLLKLLSIESVMLTNHINFYNPLLLQPSIFLSISLSNEYSGLISFRMDWFDLFVVQGTLKSLLQHHSSKASILQHSAFFMVQLSYPYMTTGKTRALTRWTLVGNVMSLLFNMLSR